ncbi:MAG TPA: response regulator [Cellvibrionaceae bacterium]
MQNTAAVDQIEFRRILSRNIISPLAVGVVSALLFVIIIFNLLSAMKWVEHTVEVISEANELAKLAVDMQTGMRGYLLTGEDDFLTPYRLAKSKFGKTVASLKELAQDNPTQVERLGRIEEINSAWQTYAQTVIDMRRNNGEYLELVRARGLREFEMLRSEFEEFVAVEQKLLHDRNAAVRQTTTFAVATFLGASIFLTGLLSFFGRRDLLRLSSTFSKNLDELHQHTELLEQQAWQRAGQARLAEFTMGKTALPLLGQTILDFLALYIDVAVAAMYVRSETGSLRRIATYGVGKSTDEQIFDGNESLVGQAAVSSRVIHVEHLPDHYIAASFGLKINSGLGQTAPSNLVLLPILNNGKPNGVVELGFLRTPTTQELNFLELIAANIGGTVAAAVSSLRLQDAFEETQQLNEELQTQQEELRVSNEELEEQSRILEESQAILENQKAELEQTNEKLTEQAVILDQKNTALNIVQVQLEERAHDLQRASKYKTEFLANMSHELRTPLNSTMILAKLLSENAKGNLDEEQVQFAQSIYSSGNDLLDLINDILDISKVEAGKLELAPAHVTVQSVIDRMNTTFAPLAAQKSLQFLTQINASAPATLFTDEQRLEQILKNLLSNAIKFTENGFVKLSAGTDASGMITFAVSDSGIGIRRDQHAIIFEAFQQADGSINRRYGGTGLGLSISRDLANLLGGSVEVHSEVGKGSTFTLLIPADMPINERKTNPFAAIEPFLPALPVEINPVQTGAPHTSPEPFFTDDRSSTQQASRSVLVVEDDAEFARILFDLSHELGYRCLVAQNAVDALQIATEYLPDAILLDIGLPGVSGMSVLQKLKSNPATRHIPVHVVSAADRSETALQLGAIGYAIKPTTRDRLKQVFEKLEGKFSQKLKRVLLVEDDEIQRNSVVKLIGGDDVDIKAVAFGEEAIELLKTTIFDCMIIDLKLPDMQGHELLERMSSEAICSFPPVIVYTGRNLTADEENALLKYSRSIIIKGARSPERLLDEVTLFLHQVESKLSSERRTMLKAVRGRDRILEGRRVLLVDDDVRNIFALTGALEQKGAVVEVGRNGFEAINKLNEIADIDIVLMDIMMPGMDGLEAMRRIRADKRFQKLPIIAITAKAMKDDQDQCLTAGASDYLAKPIDIDRLYSLLRVWMPNLERL